MNPLQHQPGTPLQEDQQPQAVGATRRPTSSLPTWRLNLMRVGYSVMGIGLALFRWPQLLAGGPWELKQGTVLAMLFAMSVLALLGLRYPRQMLPILLFEVGWKVTWMGFVALPMALDATLTGAFLEQLFSVSVAIIVIAVIPWRYTLHQYVLARGDSWR